MDSVRLSEPYLDIKRRIIPARNKIAKHDKLKPLYEQFGESKPSTPPHTGKYFGFSSWQDAPEEVKVRRNAKLNKRRDMLLNQSPMKKRAFIRNIVKQKDLRNGVMQVCSSCGENLPRGAFNSRRDSRLKLKHKRSYCEVCRQRMNREYYQKNKEKWVGINDSK